MPFSLIQLILSLGRRSANVETLIIYPPEEGDETVRDMGRWSQNARSHHDAEFARHCREKRFY